MAVMASYEGNHMSDLQCGACFFQKAVLKSLLKTLNAGFEGTACFEETERCST